jgi:hypothetical protein
MMEIFNRFFNRIKSPDTAKSAQRKGSPMASEYADLELIPMDKLPARSLIGQLYTRYVNYIDDRPPRVELDKLKREAIELEAWIRRATLDNTDEQTFLAKSVRLQLLQKTVTHYEKQVAEREQDDRSRKDRLDVEYGRYRVLLYRLKSGELKDQPTEAKRCYRELQSLIAPQ